MILSLCCNTSKRQALIKNLVIIKFQIFIKFKRRAWLFKKNGDIYLRTENLLSYLC